MNVAAEAGPAGDNTMKAVYDYDAADRRVIKTVTLGGAGGATAITRTLWSGADEIAELSSETSGDWRTLLEDSKRSGGTATGPPDAQRDPGCALSGPPKTTLDMTRPELFELPRNAPLPSHRRQNATSVDC